METKKILFEDFLSTAFDNGDYTTDDVIAFLLPLVRKVLAMHESGLVVPLGERGVLFLRERSLDFDEVSARPPTLAIDRVRELFQDISADSIQVLTPVQLHLDPAAPLRRPAYIPGYGSYESRLGHQDPQTDIFSLGLLLGSMALGLDLYQDEDLERWIAVRSNPSLQDPRIHPTLAGLITEMTELDRSRRTQDLFEVIRRLEFYRDHDPEKQADLSKVAGWMDSGPADRSSFILQKLRNRLFDTSRRNRLLFYKPNTRLVNLTVGSVPSVLHYQSIRPEHLFTWNEELAGKARDMKDIVLNKYLRFDDHPYLPAALDKVRVESRRSLQEFGLSQLKLVVAFLSWHNLKEDKTERIQSPLLLLPVELKKVRRLKDDHYVIRVLDNAAEVNPVLAGVLKDLYGIRLPDFIDLDEMSPQEFHRILKAQIDNANQGIGLNYIDKPRIRLIYREARQRVHNYNKRQGLPDTSFTGEQGDTPEGDAVEGGPAAEQLLFALAGSENNPYSWDFDVCNMVLGNFNYKKMSLVRDYNLVIDQQLEHPVFEELFSTQPRVLKQHHFDLNRPDDWHHVVQADPTQTKAILQSRTGYSYIIQGPPGTGKSQTITNLIADFVARGKSILFVCEKRAALDVVFHRLKQCGLDELCCYIHDSQADKKEFIKDLKTTYESVLDNKMDLAGIRADRGALVAKMNQQTALLGDFHFTGRSGENEHGIPIRRLIERIIALRQELPSPALDAKAEELLPSYTEWQESVVVVSQLAQALEDSGAGPVFADSPFSLVKESVFHAGNPLNLLDGLLTQALDLLDQLAPDMTITLEMLKTRVQFATILYPLAQTSNLALADPDSEQAAVFGQRMNAYRHEQALKQEIHLKNIHWKERLGQQDLEAGIALAAKYEDSFTAFLNSRWRKLKRHLTKSYDFSAHVVRPSYAQVLAGLAAEYAAEQQLIQTRRRLENDYRLDNIDTASLSIELLQNKKGDPALEFLLRHPDPKTLIASLQAIRQPLQQLDSSLQASLQVPGTDSLGVIRQQLLDIREQIGSLPQLLPALRVFTGLPVAVKDALRHFRLPPIRLEAAIARKTLHEVYQAHRSFQHIDSQVLEKAVVLLGDGYTRLQELNATLIRAYIRHKFQQQLDLAGMATGQLNEEQRKFKKSFNDGRKILENEFGKTMRYKSIRELSAKDSGMVLKNIKPIWLMSPYSVSDSMPLDSGHFDVVIFDEASQITLEEGVPALYRSGQTIIVGDEKQMPPTDFFSAGPKDLDPDDLAAFDEEDGDDWMQNDADSLLAQGVRKLDSSMLSWHYRSHYETLISFSNHAFYAGGLLTIPDKTIHNGQKTAIEVQGPADAARLADALFDRSIGYHFLPGGSYDKRSNKPEAVYIAQLVRELLSRDIKESIGIVAFSQQQQQTIENALDELASVDAGFSQRLEEAYVRTEKDQFVGLIIKNLENIQGDERDIIIMSVCYGPGPGGRMSMNFGPINKRGGEKRLNVLFSRARKHIAVISSIHHQDITNEYNDGAAYLRRFLHYAEMVSQGNMKAAATILDGLLLRQEKQPVVLQRGVFLQQLKEQIEYLGYEVAEQVGQSGFKCPLAVKARPGDETYSLGILLDDELHYQNDNLIEQYYLRPGIMERFGWKILPVIAKDWLHHPQTVLDRIQKLLQG